MSDITGTDDVATVKEPAKINLHNIPTMSIMTPSYKPRVSMFREMRSLKIYARDRELQRVTQI